MKVLPKLKPNLVALLIAGLVIGFWFFFDAEVTQHPEKSTELVAMALGTCLSAFVGGWAAFSAERSRREEEERSRRISAGNKAIFTAFTLFEYLDNLRKYAIEGNRHPESPVARAMGVDSPQAGMMQAVHFDFESLGYFLDQDGSLCAQTLMELQVLDAHYQIVRNTVEMRAKAVDELWAKMIAMTNENMNPANIPVVYGPQYRKLLGLTDQLIKMVDEGIELARKADSRLHAALAQQFPGHDFLVTMYAPEPKQAAA